MDTATLPKHRIRCGTCRGEHETAAQVRDCWAYDQAEAQEAEAVAKIEASYELWLETRFADVMRWEEDMERQRLGIWAF